MNAANKTIRIEGSNGNSYEIFPSGEFFSVRCRLVGRVEWESWIGRFYNNVAAARQAVRRFDAK